MIYGLDNSKNLLPFINFKINRETTDQQNYTWILNLENIGYKIKEPSIICVSNLLNIMGSPLSQINLNVGFTFDQTKYQVWLINHYFIENGAYIPYRISFNYLIEKGMCGEIVYSQENYQPTISYSSNLLNLGLTTFPLYYNYAYYICPRFDFSS